MKFKQARVDGGSNCDSLKVGQCLVIQLVTRMNGLTSPTVPHLLPGDHSQGNGLGIVSG